MESSTLTGTVGNVYRYYERRGTRRNLKKVGTAVNNYVKIRILRSRATKQRKKSDIFNSTTQLERSKDNAVSANEGNSGKLIFVDDLDVI